MVCTALAPGTLVTFGSHSVAPERFSKPVSANCSSVTYSKRQLTSNAGSGFDERSISPLTWALEFRTSVASATEMTFGGSTAGVVDSGVGFAENAHRPG